MSSKPQPHYVAPSLFMQAFEAAKQKSIFTDLMETTHEHRCSPKELL